jgi:hypothetical protein
MKLYDTKSAPNPRRVRIFAAEKDCDPDRRGRPERQGEPGRAEFREKNPLGGVPCSSSTTARASASPSRSAGTWRIRQSRPSWASVRPTAPSSRCGSGGWALKLFAADRERVRARTSGSVAARRCPSRARPAASTLARMHLARRRARRAAGPTSRAIAAASPTSRRSSASTRPRTDPRAARVHEPAAVARAVGRPSGRLTVAR